MTRLPRHSALVLTIVCPVVAAFGQPFPAPAPIFSNTFGGASGWDFATSLAVDPQGNVVVAGTTSSPDFPSVNAFQKRIAQPPLIASSGVGDVTYPPLGPAVDVTAMAESADGAVLYAASSSGIFRSLDSGVTWSQQLPGIAGAITLAVDAGSNNTLYAGVLGPLGSGGPPFKSVDGGQHWTAINLRTPVNSSNRVRAVATSLAASTVYVEIEALYRSRDGGVSWKTLAPNNLFLFAFVLAPSDANVVYAVASDGLLYRSADEGDTWAATGAKFGNAYPNPIVSAVAIDPQNSNTVWIVAGPNLSKSTDAGSTFQGVFNSSGLFWLSLSHTSGRLLTGGSGSAWASLDSGATWRSIARPSYVNTGFASRSSFFGGTAGSRDGFVTKWSADGSHILFSTFLHGAVGLLVAEDSAGNTYVAGGTQSPGFTATSGSFYNGDNLFLAKYDPSGSLQFAVLLGLAGATAITIGPNGNVYLLAGGSQCPHDGDFAPLALQLDPQGNLLYSRAISEVCSSNTSVGGIAVDPSGNLYVAGSTSAPNLPTSPTAIQTSFPGAAFRAGFLARLSPSGDRLTYLSYIGGDFSTASGVAIDSAGNVYVSGGSDSFPTPIQTTSDLTLPPDCGSSTQYPAFVMKLNPSSNVPLWLTKWGGGCSEVSNSVAVDARGHVWAGGRTRSNNFPTVSPLMVRGITDGFLTELSPDGTQILLSSFVPGPFALGPQDSFYIAGSVIPYPRKSDAVQINGLASPTSILVERLDSNATRAAVIETITNLNPSTYDQDPLFFWIGPGEMVRINGKGLGPATPAGAQLDPSGKISTSIAGTRVLFDGVPAPLISVSDSAIVCMSPFAIGDRASTSVQIERNGVAAPGVSVAVRPVAAQPDVLAIANPDGTANSQSNPAHWGQTITLYVTGFGDTVPSVPDGSLYQAPLPSPAVPLFGLFSYAGPAPGMVAGIWQVNVPLSTPQGRPSNPVPIEVESQPMSGGIYPRVAASVWVASQ